MDNLSSFIYIIIIAAIIFNGLRSVFRKSKTKEDEILPPFDPRQRPQTAPILETPEQKDIEIEEVPAPQPVKRKNRRKAHQPTPSSDSTQEKDIQSFVEKEETLFENPEDLKRAFIYSEILHRKYN